MLQVLGRRSLEKRMGIVPIDVCETEKSSDHVVSVSTERISGTNNCTPLRFKRSNQVRANKYLFREVTNYSNLNLSVNRSKRKRSE